jgi:uncharacterized protein (DUF58 family)
MSDSAKFLHPEAIRRISRLELRARHIVEGFLSGTHRSPYFGRSVEFLQHRQYTPGDDLRDVDWRVWARQDRLVVKQYEEDTNLRVHLLVDVSASMQFGAGVFTKYGYSATIAATLAWLILRQQDAVGALTFDAVVRSRVPVRSQRSHLRTVADALAAERPGNKTNLYGILQRAAATFPRRGMMIVISDFLCDVDETLRGLRLLRRQGHDVLVFHVMDDAELDFDFEGPTRFDSIETDEFLRCDPRALRQGYLAGLQVFLDALRRGCAGDRIDYALIRTSDALDAALPWYLNKRLGRRQGRHLH